MEQWISTRQIAEAMGMSIRGVINIADRDNWAFQKRNGKGGGKEYHISSLPKETQKALRKRQARATKTEQLPVLHEAYRSGADAAKVQMTTEADAQMARLTAINALPPREQERIRARVEVLTALSVYEQSFETKDEAVRDFVEAFNQGQLLRSESILLFIPKLSRTTLLRWRSLMTLHGPAGLSCNYKATKTSIISSQEELLAFAEGFLAKLPHSHARNLQLAIEAQFDQRCDITLPGYRAIQKWMSRWKHENRRVFMAVANPDRFKSTYQIAMGSRSEGIVRLNQLWEMDSSPADLMCTDGRYSLIACLDVYSRRPIIRVYRNSNSYGVALTLREAILAWGLDSEPTLRVDNGRDYGSHYIALVADSLGISLSQTDAYSGEQKPFVERFFKTFAHGMVEMCPGFAGHNVAEKKAIEAQFSFADRLKRAKGSRSVIEASMSSSDLQAFCDDWVNEFYMHNVHSELKCTPQERVAGWLEPVRRITDVRALDLLLEPIPGNRGIRTVQKKGLRLDGHWYLAGEMGARVGDVFLVRFDPQDIGRIYLFEESGAFAFMAQCPEITGISRAELAAAGHEAQKALAAEKKALRAKGIRINQKTLITSIMDKRKRENAERAAANNVTHLQRSEALNNDYLGGAAAALATSDRADAEAAQVPAEPSAQDISIFIESNRAEPGRSRETGADRMLRWIRLNRLVTAGQALCDIDQRWMGRYETTPEFMGQKSILDQWGEEMFEEAGTQR